MLESRVIEATEVVMHRKASEAMIELQAALLELNQLRGVAPTTAISVKQSRLHFLQSGDVEELLRLAGANNFELRARAGNWPSKVSVFLWRGTNVFRRSVWGRHIRRSARESASAFSA